MVVKGKLQEKEWSDGVVEWWSGRRLGGVSDAAVLREKFHGVGLWAACLTTMSLN